jgi:hypothetical protein
MATAGTERRAAGPLAAAAALLLLAGCGSLDWFETSRPSWIEVRGAKSLRPPREPVRRVLILPFRLDDALPAQAEALRAALAQALRDSCGYEVVAPAEADLPRSTRDQTLAGANRDAAGLIRLHREWEADAVAFGRLRFGRTHGEPGVGLELELVDARDGESLWIAADTVDARDPATRSALMAWRRHESGHDDDPDSAAQVPFDSFARFAAASFVRTLFRVPAAPAPRRGSGAGVNPEKTAQANN